MNSRTTTQLIEDLRDAQNDAAWAGFDARYRPVLIGFASKLGFSGDDASELAQQALVEFSHAYRAGKYERGKGRLSSWLIGIARNIGSDMRRRARAQVPQGGSAIDEAEADIPDEQLLTRIWAKEREAAILAQALETLRTSAKLEDHTMQAFELFALRGVPAEEVALQCGMSIETVYVVKNRLTKRLREIVSELTCAYDEGE